MILKAQFFIFILIKEVLSEKLVAVEKNYIYNDKFPKEAVDFVNEKICGIETHSIRVFFNENNTTDTTNNILRTLNSCPFAPVIVKTYNLIIAEAILEKKFTSINVFILRNNDANNLAKAVDIASKYVRGKHYSKYFVIYESISNQVEVRLEKMFRLWWSNKFADVIAMLWRDSKMEMWTFNPFKPGRFIEQVDVNTAPQDLFEDKFVNFYGHTIKVAMFAAKVRAPANKNGVGYDGTDGSLAKLMGEVLNAKIEYIEPTDSETYGQIVHNNKSASTGVIRDVYSGVADVAFNSRFMNKDFLEHNVETTVSNERDDLCIIVPTAEQAPVFHNLFRTFSVTTWCTTIGSIVFAIAVVKLLEIGQEIVTKRRDREFEKDTVQNIFFTLFQTLMGDSLTRIPTSFVIRTFMSGWILYSFLLSSAFTGILITKLVAPKFEPDIDTIAQLHESGLEIFVPALHASTINETLETATLNLLLPQMRFVTNSRFSKELQNNISQAFVVTSHIADHTVLSRVNKQTGRLMYHKMQDCLVYFPSVYIVQEGSPYLGKFNQLILKFHEYGFTKLFASRMEFEAELKGQIIDEDELQDYKQAAEAKIRALTVEHLQSAFYLFFLGIILSFIVFLGEVVVHRFTEFKQNQVIILNVDAAANYGYEKGNGKKCF